MIPEDNIIKIFLNEKANTNIIDKVNGLKKLSNFSNFEEVNVGSILSKVKIEELKNSKDVSLEIAKLSVHLLVDFNYYSRFCFKTKYDISFFEERLKILGYKNDNGVWKYPLTSKPERSIVLENVFIHHIINELLNSKDKCDPDENESSDIDNNSYTNPMSNGSSNHNNKIENKQENKKQLSLRENKFRAEDNNSHLRVSWTCKRCTFVNDSNISNCETCFAENVTVNENLPTKSQTENPTDDKKLIEEKRISVPETIVESNSPNRNDENSELLISINKNGGSFNLNDKFDDANDKFNDPNDKFNDPNDRFNDPNNKFNDPNDKFKDPNDKFNDPNDRFNDPNNKLKDPNDKLKDPNDKFNDPNHKFNDPNDRFNDPNNKFKDPNDKFNDPNDKFNDPNDKFNDPNDKFNDPNDKFNDPNDKFNDLNDKFKDPNDKFNDPNDKFKDPNDKFNDPNDKFNDPNDEFIGKNERNECFKCKVIINKKNLSLCDSCSETYSICPNEACTQINQNTSKFCTKCKVKNDSDLKHGNSFKVHRYLRNKLKWQCGFCYTIISQKQYKCLKCGNTRESFESK